MNQLHFACEALTRACAIFLDDLDAASPGSWLFEPASARSDEVPWVTKPAVGRHVPVSQGNWLSRSQGQPQGQAAALGSV